METYLVALVAFAAAMLGMAVGVLFSNRRLRGSCGGLSNMKDSEGRSICDACTNPSETCSGEPEKQKQKEPARHDEH